MAIPRKIEAFLTQHGAQYRHRVHAPAFTAQQLARAEQIPERKVAKTVVFLGDGVFALAVLPADERLDLRELREALGLSQVRLASEEEISRLFPDCEIGAMPPLGTLYGLPIYVDEALAEDDFIEFNAGTHYDVIRMDFEEFQRLTQPIIVPFGAPLAKAS